MRSQPLSLGTPTMLQAEYTLYCGILKGGWFWSFKNGFTTKMRKNKGFLGGYEKGQACWFWSCALEIKIGLCEQSEAIH